MGWLWGVWICVGILIWRLVGYWEWSVPGEWQKRLASINEKNHLDDLTYVCYWQLNPENPMAEWYIWRLYKIISQINSKLYINCNIDLGTGLSLFDKTAYLSCLQRRFPGIEIRLN